MKTIPTKEMLAKVDCRYTLVIMTAKRARQLVEGAPVLIDRPTGVKPVCIASEEIYEDKVTYEPARVK